MLQDVCTAVTALSSAQLEQLGLTNTLQLGAQTPGTLEAMAPEWFLGLACGDNAAYAIIFDQDSRYGSVNFIWHRERSDRFVYVDRIVVAAAARGKGYARALYEHVFAAAKQAGHSRVVCEVNFDPPNPASDAFHARMGFVEVGRAVLANGKTVRYLAKAL